MPGKKPLLLDLYYTNCPNLIDGVANVLNLLSEHDGVVINLHTQEKLLKTQFDTIRKYENLTYDKIVEKMDADNKIQELFLAHHPDEIAKILITELNRIVKLLLTKVKYQRKAHKNKFWTKRLEAKFKEVEVANKIFTNTGKTEDCRLLKNRKNT